MLRAVRGCKARSLRRGGSGSAASLLLVISLTGILLNHKQRLGLMPDPTNEPAGALAEALPLHAFVDAAGAAVDPETASHGVDRMDVRPGKGLVKIRFADPRVMEVTLDLHSARVLAVGERSDVFLEKLHTGEIFGDLWILLSDAGAVIVLLMLVSGYWLWLYPKSRV